MRTVCSIGSARIITLVAIILLSQAIWPIEASGQTRSSVAELQRKVKALEERIRDLETRLKKLEADKPTAIGDSQSRIDFDKLDGKGVIVADDGTFLGAISSNAFESKSISNEVGSHGSFVGSASIFNDVSRYGGEVSPQSPWNDIGTRPPKVFLKDKFIAFLTVNEAKSPRIDPSALVAYLKQKR